ncbi:HD-GYP domain-containing protein [Candidatus Magnetominusculus xianensis]|uniref:Metal dependent phosphohydrolase n=1 Tax=Candidatus Magnetominusculus xianensis TaxID=1748249 RepID=A0ABR5SJN8_9BACT|nr:HD-GYP domain-containing protein [Candidatus Magnetominusculus xianensis]KWT92811.1 metal dependent phosphohydrolase [Candidatus Magnetominusculus xianensis]MBF0403399.1 DUF3391 domain-containing protein [Nitrospirota bacterium]
MRKRIPTSATRIGMYVDGFDSSWFKTPFLKHHFEIKSQNQLDKILQSGIDHLYIDTEKGLDVLSDEEIYPAPTRSTPKKTAELPGKPVNNPHKQDEKAFMDYIKAINELLQIDKLCLVESTAVDFDLFVKIDMNIIPLSLPRNKKGSSVITKELLASPGDLLISRCDVQKYRNYLTMIAKDSGSTQSLASKNMLIKENARILIRELFDDHGSHEKVEACKDSVENIMSSIIDTKGLITNLFTVDKHDYYVYTHSVNVSVFCVATAFAMGIKSEADLFAIGLGSLLHDIGMITLPPEVLHKPHQRLTDFETDLLKGHIFEGLDIINLYNGIPPDTMFPLIEHHENLMGTGYPMGLKGDKLHLSGKIISITNTYDTLTTSRPGFQAVSPYEALAYLRDHNSLYDADILKEFISVLGKSSQ